jgi:hypothetical protein
MQNANNLCNGMGGGQFASAVPVVMVSLLLGVQIQEREFLLRSEGRSMNRNARGEQTVRDQ